MFYFQKSEKIKCCHYNFTGVFYLHRRIQPIDIQRIQKYVTNSGMILPIQFFEKSQNFEKAPKQLFSVTKKCVFVLRKLLSFAFIFCSPYLIFLNHTLQYGIAVVRRFFEMGPKSVLRRWRTLNYEAYSIRSLPTYGRRLKNQAMNYVFHHKKMGYDAYWIPARNRCCDA